MNFLLIFDIMALHLAHKRLNVSAILPLVSELRFSVHPFDKWFRFHCCEIRTFRMNYPYSTAKLRRFFDICKYILKKIFLSTFLPRL